MKTHPAGGLTNLDYTRNRPFSQPALPPKVRQRGAANRLLAIAGNPLENSWPQLAERNSRRRKPRASNRAACLSLSGDSAPALALRTGWSFGARLRSLRKAVQIAARHSTMAQERGKSGIPATSRSFTENRRTGTSVGLHPSCRLILIHFCLNRSFRQPPQARTQIRKPVFWNQSRRRGTATVGWRSARRGLFSDFRVFNWAPGKGISSTQKTA
jgi:hypothetical protein